MFEPSTVVLSDIVVPRSATAQVQKLTDGWPDVIDSVMDTAHGMLSHIAKVVKHAD